MNLEQIREIAKHKGIKSKKKVRKIDLVRAIQLEEGSFDCFATAYDETCDQTECMWREDCFQLARKEATSHRGLKQSLHAAHGSRPRGRGL